MSSYVLLYSSCFFFYSSTTATLLLLYYSSTTYPTNPLLLPYYPPLLPSISPLLPYYYCYFPLTSLLDLTITYFDIRLLYWGDFVTPYQVIQVAQVTDHIQVTQVRQTLNPYRYIVEDPTSDEAMCGRSTLWLANAVVQWTLNRIDV